MVVDRWRRRALVRLEAERVLSLHGDLCISALTLLVCERVPYQLNSQQVALFVRGHPRIRRKGARGNRSYCVST